MRRKFSEDSVMLILIIIFAAKAEMGEMPNAASRPGQIYINALRGDDMRGDMASGELAAISMASAICQHQCAD